MPKSIIIKKNGGPEVLELQDVKIGATGPDEIKVTNHAIGLNYIDTYHRSGLYPLKLPSGIGLEAAGKVEEVGSDVKEFNIGDNIAYASVPFVPCDVSVACHLCLHHIICMPRAIPVQLTKAFGALW